MTRVTRSSRRRRDSSEGEVLQGHLREVGEMGGEGFDEVARWPGRKRPSGGRHGGATMAAASVPKGKSGGDRSSESASSIEGLG